MNALARTFRAERVKLRKSWPLLTAILAPLCQAAFREWLKRRYRTLDALNHAWWSAFWSHTFTDWEEIESPSPIGEHLIHGLTLDWKRFVTHQTIDFFERECEPLRRLSPGVPITVNMMETYGGLDYWRFAPHVDVVSWDSYPRWHNDREPEARTASRTAFSHDLFRSLRGGQPFLLFPEGTTTAGGLAPLREGGLRMAYRLGIPVLPFRLEGADPHYPWVGDATLLPHLRGLARARRTRISVLPGKVLEPASFASEDGFVDSIRRHLSGDQGS